MDVNKDMYMIGHTSYAEQMTVHFRSFTPYATV